MIVLKSYRNFSCILKSKFKYNLFCFASYSDSIRADIINNEDLKEDFVNSIFNGIILETKDFFLVDKPVGVSLYRSKPLKNVTSNFSSY